MNRFNSRERVLLFVLGCLLLLAAGYYMILPQVITYRQLCQELEQTSEKIRQHENLNVELTTEQNNLLMIQFQLQELKKQFNREIRDGGLFVKLDQGALENKIMVKEVIPQKIINNKSYLHLPIIIKISGDYCNVLAYMQWLENMNDWANLSEITGFVIEPVEATGNSGHVNASLTLSLYSNVTPESKLEIEDFAGGSSGKSNGFIPPVEYQFLHNNQQNGGQ